MLYEVITLDRFRAIFGAVIPASPPLTVTYHGLSASPEGMGARDQMQCEEVVGGGEYGERPLASYNFV